MSANDEYFELVCCYCAFYATHELIANPTAVATAITIYKGNAICKFHLDAVWSEKAIGVATE